MLVPVGRYLTSHEAHVVRSRLDADGILAVVVHDNHTTVDWSVALAIGGAKVLVSDRDLDHVARVFAARDSGANAKALAAEVGDLGDLQCEVCGSKAVASKRSPTGIAVALVGLLFWVPIPVHADAHRCQTCGARWKGRGPAVRPVS